MARFVSLTVGVALVLVVAPGCGSKSRWQHAAVEGKVTLDGAPVERGLITFVPTGETKGVTTGAPIENGQYRIAAADGPVVGANRVEITASRKTGRKIQKAMADPGTMMDETVEAVPPKYNKQSTLQREVKAENNVFDFDLRTR
jgi:hypothetical protein